MHGEDITPVGKNSPFMKLPEIGGRLLFIGEVLDCCTFMHGVEAVSYTHLTSIPRASLFRISGNS